MEEGTGMPWRAVAVAVEVELDVSEVVGGWRTGSRSNCCSFVV